MIGAAAFVAWAVSLPVSADESPRVLRVGLSQDAPLIFNPSAAKIGFRKDIDPEVIAEAAEALGAMQSEDAGRPLQALIGRYFISSDDARHRIPRWVWVTLAAGSAGLGLLAACSFLLNRLVTVRTQALRHRESQLRQAAMMVGVGYWTFDIAAGLFHTNDNLFGKLFEGVLPTTFTIADYRRVIHPEDAAQLESTWNDFLSGNATQFDVTYRVEVHGRTKHLRSRAVPEPAFSAATGQICGVSMDVTPFKESETVLRESEARLSRTFDEFPVMVAFAKPDGTPVYCNGQWHEKLGYPLETIFAAAPKGITHPEDWQCIQEAREAVVQGKRRVSTLHKRFYCSDGSILWAEVTIGAIRDACGKLLHLVILAVDVTDQRRAEQELRDARDKAEAANRAKTTFLATVSHEIRTPLNAVLGFSKLLAQETLPNKAAGFAHSIHTAGNALMRVLNDVLDFSKIEADRIRIVPVPTDMSTLLGELDAVFRAEAGRKGLKFFVENRMCDTLSLMLDAKRLRQVLMNLTANAVKFTESGSVEITAESIVSPKRPNRRDVTIRVTDTGIGIPEEDRKRVFDPFEQAQTSNRRRFDGTGLGLTISKRLVDAMGGRLELESRPESGSTFTVHLNNIPVSTRSLRTPQGEASVIPQFVSTRVLVVDDVESNAMVLAELLRRLGLVPKTVSSGEAALKQIERNRPDLIMTDLIMPGVSGEEVARAVRRDPACAGIPTIGVTASTDWREWCDLSLFDAILCKPVDLASLVTALDKVTKRIDRVSSQPEEKLCVLEPDVAAAVESRFASRLRIIERGAVDFDDVLTLADELHALAIALGSRQLLDISFALVESAEHFEFSTIRRIVQENLIQESKEPVDV